MHAQIRNYRWLKYNMNRVNPWFLICLFECFYCVEIMELRKSNKRCLQKICHIFLERVLRCSPWTLLLICKFCFKWNKSFLESLGTEISGSAHLWVSGLLEALGVTLGANLAICSRTVLELEVLLCMTSWDSSWATCLGKCSVMVDNWWWRRHMGSYLSRLMLHVLQAFQDLDNERRQAERLD